MIWWQENMHEKYLSRIFQMDFISSLQYVFLITNQLYLYGDVFCYENRHIQVQDIFMY